MYKQPSMVEIWDRIKDEENKPLERITLYERIKCNILLCLSSAVIYCLPSTR